MTAIQREFPTEWSNETLDRFVFAIMGRMKVHFDENGNEIPKTKEEIAAHAKYTTSGIDKLVKAGVIKAHRFQDGGEPRFFASEVNAALRGRK